MQWFHLRSTIDMVVGERKRVTLPKVTGGGLSGKYKGIYREQDQEQIVPALPALSNLLNSLRVSTFQLKCSVLDTLSNIRAGGAGPQRRVL